MLSLLGKAAFLVGIIFAIAGGIWGGEDLPTNDTVVVVLLVAGIIIGLLNVSAKEAPVVLSATIALVVLGIWGVGAGAAPVANVSQALWENLVGVVDAFAILMVPAAVIIAIKAVIATADTDD